MKKDKTAKELVKSIIALGHNMNMHTIAEGVEDAEEAAMLREMGCASAQGYFFAKPMTESDIGKLVMNWTAPAF
jgi:EAL domain-containing protein (putative c-di-GMP-specific phosphodiesterase class I)